MGRKPISPSGKKKQRTIHLSPEEDAAILAMGGGDWMVGLRRLIATLSAEPTVSTQQPVETTVTAATVSPEDLRKYASDKPLRRPEPPAPTEQIHCSLAAILPPVKSDRQRVVADLLNNLPEYVFRCERCQRAGKPNCNVCRKANGITEI